MHRYRTMTCGGLRETNAGQFIRLSGWCHRIRDHGGVLFIDLRDHYGITQCVDDPDSPAFPQAEKLRSEWVVRIDGTIRRRPPGTENPAMPTGFAEVYVSEIEVLGPAAELPLPRPAPRAAAQEYDVARPNHRVLAQAHEGARIFRIPDPNSDGLEPGRGARFSRPRAPPSGKILCSSASAAAVQAAHHGRGF